MDRTLTHAIRCTPKDETADSFFVPRFAPKLHVFAPAPLFCGLEGDSNITCSVSVADILFAPPRRDSIMSRNSFESPWVSQNIVTQRHALRSLFCGPREIRTPYLPRARRALYQMSYGPFVTTISFRDRNYTSLFSKRQTHQMV